MGLCRRLAEPTRGVRGERAAENATPPDTSGTVGVAEATEDGPAGLLRAHLRECAKCSAALAVADLGEFCVGRMCPDGRAVLRDARRLRHGATGLAVVR
jgi:hypothetical protein